MQQKKRIVVFFAYALCRVRGKNLDESKSKGGEKKQSAVSSAFAKFENVSKLGVEQRDTALKTVHQNCIRYTS